MAEWMIWSGIAGIWFWWGRIWKEYLGQYGQYGLMAYQGVSRMDRRTLDWNLWMGNMLEAFVDPHTSMAYVNVGRRIVLYTVSLLSRESLDLLLNRIFCWGQSVSVLCGCLSLFCFSVKLNQVFLVKFIFVSQWLPDKQHSLKERRDTALQSNSYPSH
jgi:hypothetical protein